MFKSIQGIDWKHIKTASGYADHVPKAIEELISGSEEEQIKAYWKLDNYIVLQSDLYEAAYYTLLVLVEVLESNNRCGRHYIYQLLFEICNGYATDDSVITTLEGTVVTLQEACLDLIKSKMLIYKTDISDSDTKVSKSATDLVMCLEEEWYKDSQDK